MKVNPRGTICLVDGIWRPFDMYTLRLLKDRKTMLVLMLAGVFGMLVQ